MRMAMCHPEREYHARGLCQKCYKAAYQKGEIKGHGTRMAACHPERKYFARGLCRECYYAAYRTAHAEKTAAYGAAHHANHKEEDNARDRTYSLGHYAALKLAAFNTYGGPVCVCCGETLLEGLTIDHIGGDGAERRRARGGKSLYWWLKKNNYPSGFQVLCATCNQAKGTGG